MKENSEVRQYFAGVLHKDRRVFAVVGQKYRQDFAGV